MSTACAKLVLLCGVLCTLLPSISSAGEVDGLLDLDFVKRTATRLDDVVPDFDGLGRTRFFPDLRFTCAGSLSKFSVLARFFEVSGTVGNEPTFRLLRNRADSRLCFVAIPGRFVFLYFQNYYAVYDFMPSSPVSFQNGDIFAISQESNHIRRSMRYYGGQMPGRQSLALNISLENITGQECFRSESSNVYQAALAGTLSPELSIPMLAVTETDAPECIEGFLSQETLDNFIVSDIQTSTHEGEQLLFPDDIDVGYSVESIAFECDGQLSKWTVGAERRAGGATDQLLQLQVWRRTENDSIFEYQKSQFSDISSADLVPTESLNVYEIAVDPPLQFQQGDVLGVFQPRDAQVVLHYTPRQYSSGTSNFGIMTSGALETFVVVSNGYASDDVPYIRPDVVSQTPGVDSEECISKFISGNELFLVAELISSVDPQPSAKQHIIPDIMLTTTGVLTRVTIAANYTSEGNPMSNMELQVWRLSSDGTQVTLVASTAIEQPTPTADLNIYEYSVVPALPVSAGDVLGIYTPQDSQFSVLFVNNSGPLNYVFDARQQGTVLLNSHNATQNTSLLISIETSPDSVTTVPTDTNPVNFTSLTPTVGQNTTSSASTAAGVVLGLLLAILLVAGAVSVAVVYVKKKRSSKMGGDDVRPVHSPGFTNPVYGQSKETKQPCAAQKQDDQVYEIPDSIDNVYQSMEGAAMGQCNGDHVYSAPDQQALHYEIPEQYSRLFQWGVYVPTKEQREGTIGEDIYSSLGETSVPGPNPSFFEETETYWQPASDYHTLYEQLAHKKYREILRPQIRVTAHLGSGQFGTVNKGEWQSPNGAVEVAIKTLKPGSKQEDAVRFLQEAAINGQFRHPNVVKLIGVVTVGEPVMIVLELLANGDLRNYLLEKDPLESLDASTLLSFSKDVSKGMEHLANKNFVHRDLAARNILVAADKTCKISDFGMSRDLEDETYYVSHGGKIPVKWTAPEALHFKKYSTASDVWSFGAVMYEIWSLGHKPFEGYTNAQALKMVDKGFRLPPPPGCPNAIYGIMIQCWNGDKSARPSFTALVSALSEAPSSLLYRTEEEEGSSVLGGPLESSKSLHTQLQTAYIGGDYD